VGDHRKLTVGIATYNDYDGAYFTVTALRLYHPEVADDVDLLVVDNDPSGPAAWPLKALEYDVERLRYVPVDDISSAAVKDRVIREANSDWVLVLDSHVLVSPGGIAPLLRFLEEHPDCDDLLQGPLLARGGHFASQVPRWDKDLFGQWRDPTPDRPDPDAEPQIIEMQGLGLFACRKETWPGYSPLFRGHGAEEFYLHEKYRRRGNRTLSLPFLSWTHRFTPPGRGTHRITYDDRIRNFLIAFEEIERSTDEVLQHFASERMTDRTDDIARRWEREKNSPLAMFEVIAVLDPDRDDDRWERLHQHVATALGVEKRLRRITLPPAVPAGSTKSNAQVVRALAHRQVLARARNEDWRCVLVLDEDFAMFPVPDAGLLERLEKLAVDDAWMAADLSGLGAWTGGRTATAIAYHQRAYAPLLSAIPEDPVAARAALSSGVGTYDGLVRGVVPLIDVGT
jgi:hypothetical protein